MNLKINQRHSEGFSLIELIFVITVIGVLAGVSIPSLINWKYFQDLKTRQLALKTNLEKMKSDAKRWGATCIIDGKTLKSSCTSAVLQKSKTDKFDLQSTKEVIVEPTVKYKNDNDIYTATNFNRITLTPRGFIHINPIQSGNSTAIFILGFKSKSNPFRDEGTELCVIVENLTGRISTVRRDTRKLGTIKTNDAIYARSGLTC